MPIVFSEIVSQTNQQGGTIAVVESHRDHRGRIYPHSYTAAAGLDIYDVLAKRAIYFGASIDEQEAAELEANNFEMPLSQIEFLIRFTDEERAATHEKRRTDAQVEDAWGFVMAAVNGIHLNNPLTIKLLMVLEAKQIITAERRQIIGTR